MSARFLAECPRRLGLDDIILAADNFYTQVVEDFLSIPFDKPILLLQCSSVKPYSYSNTFRNVVSEMLSRGLRLSDFRIVFALDGFGWVRYEYERKYPYSCYDVSPEQLSGNRELQSFVRRIVCETSRHIPKGHRVYACVVKVWWNLVRDCMTHLNIRRVDYGFHGVGCRRIVDLMLEDGLGRHKHAFF